MTALALAFSIYYTPDYLHLTVNAQKKQRWEIKIRWRVIAAALVLGLLSISSLSDVVGLLAAVGWLTAANLLAQRLRPSYCSFYFWTMDFIMLAVLLLSGWLSPLLGAIFLATAAHLSIVISEESLFLGTAAVASLGALLLLILWLRGNGEARFFLAAGSLLLIAACATAFLVARGQRRNARNIEAAMRELVDFTGYPPERIRHLWSVSNQELAENWNSAGLAERDAAGLAEWYRVNSQLYMFAISAYNLEYTRILSNLKVLRFARSSCLDYGAGNGEIWNRHAGGTGSRITMWRARP